MDILLDPVNLEDISADDALAQPCVTNHCYPWQVCWVNNDCV
jgi:hypothetical protein